MGPGPITADPRVLRAMSAQLVGQYDPWMTDTMNEVMALYRQVFITDNQQTMLVDGTSRAGIEAALVSLLEPGDRVLVPIFGRFGHLLAEICRRAGADVHTIETEWGQVFTEEALEAALVDVQPKVLAIVHGDTSTTVAQPLEGLGELCERHGALLYVDCTATLGGNEFRTDEWGVDVATAGLQKCLGGPSGSAPVTFSPRAAAVIEGRKSIEAGIRAEGDPVSAHPIRSNYLDMAQIFDYWSERRLNHHTEATTMLFGARECARILLQEGLAASWARHGLHGRAMLAGTTALGLEPFGALAYRMTNVVGVHIPDGLNGDGVRATMLEDFGIEIGTSFGPLHGKVWRIGTMGYNARTDAVLQTLAALEAVLRRAGHGAPAGAGVDAAYEVYGTGS
jgi:(S)-ureidoglycine-glyoxylate aminotransferase